jgi:methylenetetrahydrofolate reductase (NADPH)
VIGTDVTDAAGERVTRSGTKPHRRASREARSLPTRLEIIPTEGITAGVRAHVPAGSTITVTCLPHHGIARTMQTALQLAGMGYSVVPHLAARSIGSRGQLEAALRDCRDAGIREVFAIGGDASEAAGPYSNSLQLLEDIMELSGGDISAGVAGYPEGHPHHGELQMLDALLEKQHLASGVTTQMCFSVPRISWYAETLRREGVQLPIWAGVPGAVPRAKLIALAGKIGVGPSLKFLTRQGPLGRRLLSGSSYSPLPILDQLRDVPEIAGIHLYTFNSLGHGNPQATS